MIRYDMIKTLQESDLDFLFRQSANPRLKDLKKLRLSFENSDAVYTAWDESKLVGIINCISDKISTAFFPILYVHPEYRRKGIGQFLMNKMLQKYSGFRVQYSISGSQQDHFFSQFNFEKSPDFELRIRKML